MSIFRLFRRLSDSASPVPRLDVAAREKMQPKQASVQNSGHEKTISGDGATPLTCRACRWLLVFAVGVLALVIQPVLAQGTGSSGHSSYVFVQHNVDTQGRNELIFVDLSTGEETTVLSYGERYTVAGDGVIFFDPVNVRVMFATPEGVLRDHPFIQVAPDTRRVEWVLAPDGHRIAWTLTHLDPQGRLATLTTVADIDGRNRQVVLTDVDTFGENLRIFPVGFSADSGTLYVDDAHVDGITQFVAFDQYVNIFALDLATGDLRLLPGEQGNCICGADLGAGLFVRLRLTSDLAGFNLYVHDLEAGTRQIIRALRLVDYDTAGDVLIAPDGSHAVYALAQIGDYGASREPVRTVFVLADLQTMTQEALTRPLTTFVRPVEWTEDNSAIIFTSPTQDGTWKISLSDGRLDRIAEATYIGRLTTETD